MAVSLSTNTVKLYSPVTGQFMGECSKGHSSTINEISFSGPPSTPHLLHSCSSDGTIRAWDTRSFQQVSCVSAGPSEEIFSFSFGGVSNNLLAAGCKSQVLLWDWRMKKQVACLEESHMDDVTQVDSAVCDLHVPNANYDCNALLVQCVDEMVQLRASVHFVPDHQNKLISASVDGLLCTFDTSGDINDDDNLESVINIGTSIGKVGFLGEANEKLWCLSHIETLSPNASAPILPYPSVWDWKDARLEANFDDARSLASNSWTLDHVDYFVDCHYSVEDDRLWVIGGTNAGTLGYFPVNYKGIRAISSPEAVLHGGHTGVVRSVLPMSNTKGRPSQGTFGWTGGEDGRLCCWLSDESCESNRSWISSTLVMKSPHSHRKSRRQPY
ncbi:hypothetical protein RJ640_019899 [Escallonia rubra]|uniref:Transducin/WD40 repeat-like superfamily protein n=1 Tax=Escallonia rubra TaxID=112253 RepID=A0AA88RIY0_9ASTE|nr:hypothetical protein RJ640_019899 [Escallonia rubra]